MNWRLRTRAPLLARLPLQMWLEPRYYQSFTER